MKMVKIISLGAVIWSLSLLWPEINQVANDSVLISLGLVLCLVMLIYNLVQSLHRRDNHHRPGRHHLIRPASKVLPR